MSDAVKERNYVNRQPAKSKGDKPGTTLPKPKSFVTSPAVFFTWISKFNDDQRGRAILHWYREWPVVDMELVGQKKQSILYWAEGQPLPFEPEDWEQFVSHHPQLGSGKYKVLCTEAGLAGAISMCKIKVEDSQFPPQLDIKSLVIGHPENKGFENKLRMQGVQLPGDPQKEDHDMNVAAQLVDTVTKTNERLMDRIEELQGESQEDVPVAEALTNKAVEKGFEVMANASKAAMEMQASANKNAMDVVTEQNKKLASMQAPDPLEYLKKAKEILSPPQTDKNDKDEESTTMKVFGLWLQSQQTQLTAMQTMQDKVLTFMENLEAKRNPAAATQAAASNGISGTLETMKQIKEVAELFGMRSNRREIEAPPPSEPSRPWYQSYLENPMAMGMILALAQGAIGALFNRGGGTPKPVADILREAQEAGKTMLGSLGQPGQTQPQPPPQDPRAQALAWCKFIEPVFIAHFFDTENQGLSGYTFAAEFRAITQNANGQIVWIPNGPATPFGVSQYRQIKAGGVQQMDQLIQSYEPIWTMVQGQRPRYQQFLRDFFEYEEESARQTSEDRTGAPAGVQ